MKIPKRPKAIKIPISYRVHPETMEAIKSIMKENMMTLTEVAEWLVEQALLKYERAQK